jgi:hypothetical protein
VATREQVLRLIAEGCDYPAAAARLGVSAGAAYLTGTGRPADGSGTVADGDPERPGLILTSAQHLSNPPAVNPTSDPAIREWIRRRATADLAS